MAVIVRPGISVGALSAEDDASFLQNCFVDTVDVNRICDINSPRSIVLGRTGSGKSALLLRVEETQKNVVRINPDSLSLNYISNSDILKFFEELDIDLDLFYQLLWRHVLVVEILQLKKNKCLMTKRAKILYLICTLYLIQMKKRKELWSIYLISEIRFGLTPSTG